MTHTPDCKHRHTETETGLPLLRAESISYTYPGSAKPALNHATLTLFESDRMALIGHNGSGKTTLLHAMMGLIPLTHGSIWYNGKTISTEADFRLLRREVGYLFQQSDDQLFSPTVIEDVAFGPLNLGMKPDEARERASETLRTLGMNGFEDRITHRLSGGEKKMVALASVLAMRPKVLLLDEPTNDLDPDTRERLIEHLNQLSVTRCIISHDWDFLERTCSRFVSLHKGTIQETEHVPHVHVHIHDGGNVDHKHEDSD
ncbi:energy-coupling factor ABC transporter ATP-binding protein [Desulfovibrio mangrovi]|uniref:energy-coupling factor ABC transporter ATP-binding protein n=1 Tax=Desulfovibrio mangrovi TaxID=2976983 RepID=UPI0022451B46|nr:ABC transporter ATP-binding protein [Desulfovibrio mangrovi]UZP67930.1 energy-coupling factor ABC transporter ATP-binding protein [Desulfovibrio mangrovi]